VDETGENRAESLGKYLNRKSQRASELTSVARQVYQGGSDINRTIRNGGAEQSLTKTERTRVQDTTAVKVPLPGLTVSHPSYTQG
jgi:fructose-1,6-bisphosphatase